jgi:hypothetical protein
MLNCLGGAVVGLAPEMSDALALGRRWTPSDRNDDSGREAGSALGSQIAEVEVKKIVPTLLLKLDVGDCNFG